MKSIIRPSPDLKLSTLRVNVIGRVASLVDHFYNQPLHALFKI